MKGYKAFGEGLVCRGKQYAENTVFEENEASPCECGMHFCENPLDVLDYYPLLDDDCKPTEFAEVESLADIKTDDNKKFVTTKLKIGARLDLKGFVNASISFLMERGNTTDKVASGEWSKLAASGYRSQLAASGDGSQLAASGDGSQLAASGYVSQLAASGDRSQLAASGYGSQLAASGEWSKLAASGDGSQLALNGKNGVGAAIGVNSQIKGVLGSWITLAEYGNGGKCLCVKSAQIDGEKIKENAWYKLEHGEFIEARE